MAPESALAANTVGRARSELLARIADTLRSTVAPAVGVPGETTEYARTQAHMAAVILRRVARELAEGPALTRSTQDDLAALHTELEAVVGTPEAPSASDDLTEAVAHFGRLRSLAALNPVIECAYASDSLRDPLMQLIRPVLRREIDRTRGLADG